METDTDNTVARWRGAFIDLHCVGMHDAVGIKFRRDDAQRPQVYVCKLQRARRSAPRGPPESWRLPEPGVDAEFHVVGRIVRQAYTMTDVGSLPLSASQTCATLSVTVAPREDPVSQVQWSRIPAAVHDVLVKLCPAFPVDISTFLTPPDHGIREAELNLEAAQLQSGQDLPSFPLFGAGDARLEINKDNIGSLSGLPVHAVFKLVCRPKPQSSFEYYGFHGELTRLELASI